MNQTKAEVDVLTEYLIHKNVSDEKIYAVYEHLTKGHPSDKATTLAFQHPILLPFLDAGFVFVKSNSDLRRRIHIVFATLESTPQYAHLFMAEKVGFFGVLRLGLIGVRGVLRALVGVVLVKALRV